jgi:hypothetical protein
METKKKSTQGVTLGPGFMGRDMGTLLVTYDEMR